MSSGITPTGFQRKRLNEIKTDLEALFQTVYGNNINLSPESPDGQIIGLLAGSFSDLWEIAEGAYNAYNPSAATGATLSNLVQINGITRNEASSSVVVLTFTGVNNTTIPAGTLVSHITSQEQFSTDVNVVISGGSANVTASSVNTGVIEASAGTLTEIETPITGVASVTNIEDANVGSERETDVELRARRLQSLAISSQSTVDSLYSVISNLEFVTQTTILENDTDVTDSNGLPPHSIQAIVVGGLDEDIGNAIWLNKPAGINSFGDDSVVILDSQGLPHTINFSRPDIVDIYVLVELTKFSNYPANGDQLIKQAIVDYCNGNLVEGRGFGLGEDVIFSELYTPINSIIGHQIDELYISISPVPTSQSNIVIDINEISNFTVDNISVV
ncbi:MAG: putative baseplate protein J [Prokaryotic dsDNA virus sp.]|nr:MAG: putative baseplate protein J [Prokaryotic dsDNA virus sp.]|tara:strand:+ start:37652 stop:38818 length:1167 start_codon:yes stop_codon:yes gene_type:complete